MFEGSDANDYVKSSPPKITMAVIKTWLSVWPWENHYTYDTKAFFQNLYIFKVSDIIYASSQST